MDTLSVAVDPHLIALAVSGVTATVGTFVAYQGYRGFTKHRNRTLLFLSVGVLLLTAVPFLGKLATRPLSTGGSTESVLLANLINLAGLAVIFYAFTRTFDQ